MHSSLAQRTLGPAVGGTTLLDRDSARAAIIALVLCSWVVLGLPVPLGLDEADFEDRPRVREEVARWADTLASLGVEVGTQELYGHFMSVVQPVVQVRSWVLTPLRPLTRELGLNQRWALYASPPADPALLVIEGHDEDGWRTLYRTLDDEHDWRVHQFKYRRMRGMWSRLDAKGGKPLVAFADWVAEQAFADLPALDRVRVRIVRVRTALPGEPGGGKETEVRKRTVSRKRP